MFIQDSDYNTVIDSDDLRVIQNQGQDTRTQAENRAIETISSYLRSRYDVQTIFGATGSARIITVVGWAVDIALYHMFAKMPGRMGYEIRKERYDAVITELESINKGKVTPDLPLLLAPDGSVAAGPVKWGSEKANNNYW